MNRYVLPEPFFRDDDRGGGGGGGAEHKEWQETQKARAKAEARKERQRANGIIGLANAKDTTLSVAVRGRGLQDYMKSIGKYTQQDNSNRGGGEGNRGGSGSSSKNFNHDSYKKLGVDKDIYKAVYDEMYDHKSFGGFSKLGSFLKSVGSVVGDIVKPVAKPLGNAVANTVKASVDITKDTANGVVRTAEGVVKGDVDRIIDGISDVGKGIGGGTMDFINAIGGGIVGGMGGAIEGVLSPFMVQAPEIPEYDPLEPEYENGTLITDTQTVQTDYVGNEDPILGGTSGVNDERGKLAKELKA